MGDPYRSSLDVHLRKAASVNHLLDEIAAPGAPAMAVLVLALAERLAESTDSYATLSQAVDSLSESLRNSSNNFLRRRLEKKESKAR